MKQMVQGTYKAACLAFLTIALSACGGSGGSSSSAPDPTDPPTTNPPQSATGIFLDSAVEGLSYSSGALSGFTDADGRFEYEVDNTVIFSIGSITIGAALGADTITPLELVNGAEDETDDEVVNILRFLQTLDNDANPDNGIQITSIMRDLAVDTVINFDQTPEEFTDDGIVQTVLATMTSGSDAGARLLLAADIALAHFRETLDGINGIPTGSGDDEYCAANTPNLTSTRGNVYVFEVPSGSCLGITEDNSPKKTVPLSITEVRIHESITEGVDIHVEDNARLYLRSEGFNISGFDLNYSFEITNNSAHDYCITPDDIHAKDAAGNILDNINIFGEDSAGSELFLNRSQRCFSPGYTQSYVARSNFISREDFDKIASLEIERIVVNPLRDLSTVTKAEELDAQMNWTISPDAPNYPALRVTLTNNIGRDIRLDKSQHRVWFFDNEGYALSTSFVRLHEALGFEDDDQLSDDDYIIMGNSEVFSLLDEVADNAAVTPSRATKARVYLRWDYVSP
ncbi:MAG: hypothetical protein ACRBB3_09240 [Alphaproteobacteria bacterium]